MADSLSDEHYQVEYRRLMLRKIGFSYPLVPGSEELVGLTIQLCKKHEWAIDFFAKLAQMFSPKWREDISYT